MEENQLLPTYISADNGIYLSLKPLRLKTPKVSIVHNGTLQKFNLSPGIANTFFVDCRNILPLKLTKIQFQRHF